ncbi:MAG: hypothetical protein AAF492_26345, partial [Verrucomicrobiota bacterium]
MMSRLIGPFEVDESKRIWMRVADDRGRYYASQNRLLDLRYQDGQVIVARGDLVYFHLPVAAPPTDIRFHAERKAHLHLLQVLDLPPIPWKATRRRAPAEMKPAASLGWEKDRNYHGREDQDPAEFRRRDDGSVEWTTKDGREWRKASVSIDRPGPMTVIVKVEEMTQGACLVFQEHSVSWHALKMGRLDEHSIASHDAFNRGQLDKFRQRGFVMEFPFYCRVVYGLDRQQLDYSFDGTNWIHYGGTTLNNHTRQDRIEIQLLMEGKMLGKPQGIRVSEVAVIHHALLNELVDPDLVKRVPAFDEKMRRVNNRWGWERQNEDWMPARPEGVSKRDWKMACYRAIMERDTSAVLDHAAAVELIRAAAGGGATTGNLLDRVQSLEPFIQRKMWSGQERTPSVSLMLEAIGVHLIERNR